MEEEKKVEGVAEKSKRDLLNERLKKKYPDREYADDEALFGQVNDDYDAYDNELGEYKNREQQFVDMFTADPRSANFVNNWRKGEHPMTSFIREFGREGLEELVNNEEKLDEFAKAEEEYLAKVAETKKLKEEYDKNLDDTLSIVDAFQSENGLTDEQVDEVLSFLSGVVRDGLMGKYSKDSLVMAMKALHHDEDVTTAETEGEVRGRNAKIEEKLRKNKGGDGTPNLAGSNNGATRSEKKTMNIFDFADAAK